MAANDQAGRSTSPSADDSFPNPTAPFGHGGPPSIISSRMTDIASDDGGETDAHTSSNQRRSGIPSEGGSRTGQPSTRPPRSQAQPLRKNYLSGLAAKRASGAGSVSGSTSGTAGGAAGSTRPASSTGRSHVPSLTSHAFFHPMSSQKLQAQRGGVGSRPPTMSSRQQQYVDDDASALGDGASTVPATTRQSLTSNHMSRLARQLGDEAGAQAAPPSRGSEMTEQETLDRITANTSPTQGHHPTGSLSESMRPLQRKPNDGAGKGLSIDVDKGYKERGVGVSLPSPIKSPRSFRSGFLLQGKGGNSGGDQAEHGGSGRQMDGTEKLSSTASTPRLQPSDAEDAKKKGSKEPKPKTNLGRVHQYFEGNMVFWFGGRWQNAKQQPVNIATFTFMLTPCVLFLIFSAPWLWHNISPAIPITFAYLFYVCASSAIHASVSDPGILPRNLHRFPPVDENEDPLRIGPPTNDWVLIKSAESATAAMEVPVKHCRTCNIWRPPRAHHCRLCDNCIETHDHHCVWLNNCIGRRNYRYFFAFVSTASLLALYVIGASLTQILVHMTRNSISFGDSINEFRVPFANVILGFIAFLYPAALTGYHLWLMARGETTRELMHSQKFAKTERYRAFTQGSVLRNWIAVLCRPRPPTYYQFKARYANGDQRLAQEKKGSLRRARTNSATHGMEMQTVGPPTGSGFQGPVALRNEGSSAAN